MDVHGVAEPGGLDHGERLGTAHARLAVQHDLASCGSEASAWPERISPLGISTEPGICTISYSFGSRTSTRWIAFSALSQSLSSLTVMVEPTTASAASSEIAPQKSS